MNNGKRKISREIGLEIAAIYAKFFFKSQHLHYGYWTSDLDVDITNLRTAQDNYANFLISHIPDGTKTILDVGCGTGEMARRLLELGYNVDCVSPSSYLSDQARQVLPETTHIFDCYYEDLQTENRYDLVLFVESFQYVNPEEAIKKTISVLNPAGHALICDVFKKDMPTPGPLSGGHPLAHFYNLIAKYPLELITDLDITEQTAPTRDIENALLNQVVKPTVELVQELLDDKYPVMSKLVKFLHKKKIDKMNRKYFSGQKTGANFAKWKSYRLLLYKK